jgi:pimeloyl-ACP methyl ester carboxylesterase
MALEHQVTRVNGIRMHYVRDGTGPPVILLHGWPHTWYCWRKVIPALATRYSVIAGGPAGLRTHGQAPHRIRQADDGRGRSSSGQ